MSRQVEDLRRFVGVPAEPARTLPNVVVTAGGKGGVGTSSVTALVSLGLARAGRRVLVVDGSAGSLHLLLGLDATGAADQEAVEWVGGGLAVLPRAQHPEGSISMACAIERKAVLARVVSLHSEFDLVLIDAGSRVDSVVQACSLGVNRLLTVTDAGRLSLSGTFGLLRSVSARFPRLPLQLVVNRERPESLSRVDGHIRSALQHFHMGPVDTAGLVPFDPDLEGTTRRGGLLQDLPTSSLAARSALRLGLTMALRPNVTPALAPTGS